MEHISLLLVKLKNKLLHYKKVIIYSFWAILNIFILCFVGYYLANRLTGEMVFQVNSIQVKNSNYIPKKGYLSHELIVDMTITNGTNKDLDISYKQFQLQGKSITYPAVLEVSGNPTEDITIARGEKAVVEAIYEPFDITSKSKFVIPAIYNAPTITMDVKS